MRPTLNGVQIIVRCGEEYLVVKHSYRSFGYYDFVGGRKDKGETYEQAARRELYEETGIIPIELILVKDMNIETSAQPVHVLLYEASTETKEVLLDLGELLSHAWLTRDSIEERLSPFSKIEWNEYRHIGNPVQAGAI